MIKKLLPFLVLLTLFIGLSIAASDTFLTETNLKALVRQTAVINIMALGMTLIIITGGIDLSVGSILALAGFVGCTMMEHGQPIAVAILIGILVGGLAGLLNGLMVTRLKINSFIVTLGTLGIYRGLTLILSNGLPVHQLPREFNFLGEGEIARIPLVLWILLLVALLVHFLLEHTRMGRYAFAIGSNAEAAHYSGIPVALHTTAPYAIAGLLTGLAGMIEASRLSTGQPTAGQGYELQAIAAVVIGGGSLRGGEGSITGTLVGAFIMGLLANGSDLLGVSPYYQQVLIGTIIIAAVYFDELRKRNLS
jgi:ribose transport system permease protein